MARLLAALASALLAATAAAQSSPPPPRAAPPPASAQSAPSGNDVNAIEKAKSLGKLGVQRVAPKLGRAEKLVRKQADPIVEKAVDFAAEKVGLEPRR